MNRITEEEQQILIQEAKKRYPIGTSVISILGTVGCITSHNFTIERGYLKTENGDLYLHDILSEAWAKVINYPEDINRLNASKEKVNNLLKLI